MKSPRRGATLSTVLLVLTLGSVLIFAAAITGFYNLRLSVAFDDREHAQNLAESAITMALAEIARDESFGLSGESLEVPLAPELQSRAQGVLSFGSGVAPGEVSTNNIRGTVSVPGAGGVAVPRGCIRLLGVGRCGDVEYVSECIFQRPPTPNGIVSTGTIDAENLVLAGITHPSAFGGSLASTSAEELLPAHLFSNHQDPGAVVLRPGCDVSGNVGAAGGLQVQPGALVRGELRPGATPITIPDLNIARLVSQIRGAVGEPMEVEEEGVDFEPIVGNFQYLSGDQVVNGDLDLGGGAICVEGNLVVTGRLRGHGALVATGDLSLGRGSDFSAAELVALAAGGDVTLTGQGRASSFFHGLIYSEGSLNVSNITVLGSLVVNASPGEGRLRLVDSTVVHTPVTVTVRQGLPAGGNGAVMERRQNGDGDQDESTGGDFIDVLVRAAVWSYQANRKLDADGRELFDLTVRVTQWGEHTPAEEAEQQEFSVSDVTREELGGASQLFGDFLEESEFSEYMAALSGGDEHPMVLSFDLNEVITPAERSRVLRWARLR